MYNPVIGRVCLITCILCCFSCSFFSNNYKVNALEVQSQLLEKENKKLKNEFYKILLNLELKVRENNGRGSEFVLKVNKQEKYIDSLVLLISNDIKMLNRYCKTKEIPLYVIEKDDSINYENFIRQKRSKNFLKLQPELSIFQIQKELDTIINLCLSTFKDDTMVLNRIKPKIKSYTGIQAKLYDRSAYTNNNDIPFNQTNHLLESLIELQETRNKLLFCKMLIAENYSDYVGEKRINFDRGPVRNGIITKKPASVSLYENSNIISENSFLNTLQFPLSTFSTDADGASYCYIRSQIEQFKFPDKNDVRIEEMINYFDYNFKPEKENNDFSFNSQLTNCPWNQNHKLLIIGLRANEVKQKIIRNNFTFLIDVSGSMQSSNKLPLVKETIKKIAEQCGPKDFISIVTYAGSSKIVLEPTSGREKEKIISILKNLEPEGSTNGAGGIIAAYELNQLNINNCENSRIILATDGDFNVGISSDFGLMELIKEKRNMGSYLSVMGFGNSNYEDAKMQKLANKGNGNHFYIDSREEAERVAKKSFDQNFITAMKDVKIQIEFNPAYVKAYRQIGYENRALNNEDFEIELIDAAEIGSGQSIVACYEIIPSEGAIPQQKLSFQQKVLIDSPDDLLNFKIAYKDPKTYKSKIWSTCVTTDTKKINQIEPAYKLIAAVAQFGLIVQNSDFKANAHHNNIIDLAKESNTELKDNEVSSFIKLVKKYKENEQLSNEFNR